MTSTALAYADIARTDHKNTDPNSPARNRLEGPIAASDLTGHPKAEQILCAAGELFMTMGFAGTSMGQIATHAGVSKGTLYNYFADKEALFAAIVHLECQNNGGYLFRLEPGDRDVRRLLTEVCLTFAEFVFSDRAVNVYRMVLAEVQRFPALGEIFYENGPRPCVERLSSYLAWADAEGLIDIPEPRSCAWELLETCKSSHWMRRLLNLEPAPTGDEIRSEARRAVDRFLTTYPLKNGA